MSKQKQKSKLSHQAVEQFEESLFKEYEHIIHHFGAWLFAISVLTGSVHLSHQFVTINEEGRAPYIESSEHAARAQGERETARLPDEVDVGLRAPAISGQ